MADRREELESEIDLLRDVLKNIPDERLEDIELVWEFRAISQLNASKE